MAHSQTKHGPGLHRDPSVSLFYPVRDGSVSSIRLRPLSTICSSFYLFVCHRKDSVLPISPFVLRLFFFLRSLFARLSPVTSNPSRLLSGTRFRSDDEHKHLFQNTHMSVPVSKWITGIGETGLCRLHSVMLFPVYRRFGFYK